MSSRSSKRFVVDKEETASLRSAPKVKRHYCAIEDLVKKQKNCTTPSGANKYFMKEETLIAHYKTVHRVAVKMEKDDDSVSSTSSMEEEESVKKPKKKSKSAKKPEPESESEEEPEPVKKPKKKSKKPVVESESDEEPQPAKKPKKKVVKPTKKQLETVIEVADAVDDLVDDLDQLNTDSDEEKGTNTDSSVSQVYVVPKKKGRPKKANVAESAVVASDSTNDMTMG